jgi:hypothetical protein
MIGALLLLTAIAAGSVDTDGYKPSPAQQRVDRSFSDILIVTPLDKVRSRLTEIRVDGCEEYGECEWRDADGVRYFLWADEPFAYFVVDKWVQADEFERRPIPALEIGLARERGEVLRAARRFVRDIPFECHELKLAKQWETCLAFLDPGNVSLEFDRQGALVTVHLSGYHFT